MKMENLDRMAKNALVVLAAWLIFGCDGQPEEAAKQGQDTEITTGSDQSNEIAAEVEAGSESVEPEETLESILKRADEIIQRTRSSVGTLDEDEDTLPAPGEIDADRAKRSEPVLATVPAVDQAAQKSIDDDGLDLIKATPELIRKVQQALTDAGFNPGSADGKLGPRTRGALADFQNQNRLTAGKLTKETLRKLAVPF